MSHLIENQIYHDIEVTKYQKTENRKLWNRSPFFMEGINGTLPSYCNLLNSRNNSYRMTVIQSKTREIIQHTFSHTHIAPAQKREELQPLWYYSSTERGTDWACNSWKHTKALDHKKHSGTHPNIGPDCHHPENAYEHRLKHVELLHKHISY